MTARTIVSPGSIPGLAGVESTYPFFIDAWMRARAEVLPQNENGASDEDVNIYVAYLLAGVAEGQYLGDLRRHTSPYAHEVVTELARCGDDLSRYNVTRSNADFLLLALGIFRGAARTLPVAPEKPSVGEQSLVRRARAFYMHAAGLAGALYGRSSAQARVLLKLGTHFQRYLAVLRHMRGDSLCFVSTLTEGEIFHLVRSIDGAGADLRRMRRWDAFLDAYRIWELHPSDAAWTAVQSLGRELEKEDATFSMDRFQASLC
jgi:hypothetical protein